MHYQPNTKQFIEKKVYTSLLLYQYICFIFQKTNK